MIMRPLSVRMLSDETALPDGKVAMTNPHDFPLLRLGRHFQKSGIVSR
jgi:hypothetical protein